MGKCLRLPALCVCVCLCTAVVAQPTNGTGAGAETPTGEPLERLVSEYALLVDKPSIALYSPIDASATRMLVDDWQADVPDFTSCAYFNRSVYCVGGVSVNTWRFSHVDGRPLAPGPDLNRDLDWPGNGRMASIDDEWLVTCGGWRSYQPNTCQILHINASQWTEVHSEACGKQSAVAQHNGSVFVVGGWCNAGGSAEVWSLQINSMAAGNDTFQWRRHPDMNRARDQLAITSHKGFLYACGGYDVDEKALSDCERWREGMHSWQVIAPLPQPRERLQMLSVDGHLIVMGGYDRGGTYKLDVFDYDQAEDTWHRLHDIPAMSWFGSAVVPAEEGGEWREKAGTVDARPAPVTADSVSVADRPKAAHVPQRASSNTTATEYAMLIDGPSISVYSPLDPSATEELVHDWQAVPSALACAHFDGTVHCVGDKTTKTWRFSHVDGRLLPYGPDLNRDVEWPGNGRMAAIEDEWLVTCGDWRSDQPNTCQVLHINASQWVEVESEACGKQSAVAQHNGSAFVAGGWCSGVSAEVWSLQINSMAAGNDTFQWRRHPDMNTARDELAIASHNGWLYACGGYILSHALSDCERWREGMDSWQVIAPLPEPRERLHMLSVDGRLIVMGGYDSDGAYKLDVFDYDGAEDTWSRLHDMPDIYWFGSAVVPAL